MIRRLLALAVALTLAAPVAARPVQFVVLGPAGETVARAIVADATCPTIVIDGRARPMTMRAPTQTIALRPTRSDPVDSKPSAFPVSTCETTVPRTAHRASIDGVALPLPARIVKRIVVIGDTGCRLKKSDHAWQGCNDPAAYPFARIAAAAAAWKPDLVVHVGDYEYRENACPSDQPQCSGSPWGYGWDAWNADFFAPAQQLLAVAPLALTRGNHESCLRAGQGWWRFLDPRPHVPHRDCNVAADDAQGDYSLPYAIPLGQQAQLVMLDLAIAGNKPLTAADPEFEQFRSIYREYARLSAQAPYTIAANHQPILAFTGDRKSPADAVALKPGNRAIQSAFASINPSLIPANVQLLLSGHVHLWQQLSFGGAYPSQFVAGFSGTQEDVVPLPPTIPAGTVPAPGADVATFSSWVDGFGWMSMERTGAARWKVTVWDVAGHVVNRCTVRGRLSRCDVRKVRDQ